MLLERPAHHRHQLGRILARDGADAGAGGDSHQGGHHRRTYSSTSSTGSSSSDGGYVAPEGEGGGRGDRDRNHSHHQQRHRRAPSASAVFDSMKGRGIIAQWTAAASAAKQTKARSSSSKKNRGSSSNGRGKVKERGRRSRSRGGGGGGSGASKNDSSVLAQVNMEGGRDGQRRNGRSASLPFVGGTNGSGGAGVQDVGGGLHSSAPPKSFDLEGWLSGGGGGGGGGGGAFQEHDGHGHGGSATTLRSSSFHHYGNMAAADTVRSSSFHHYPMDSSTTTGKTSSRYMQAATGRGGGRRTPEEHFCHLERDGNCGHQSYSGSHEPWDEQLHDRRTVGTENAYSTWDSSARSRQEYSQQYAQQLAYEQETRILGTHDPRIPALGGTVHHRAFPRNTATTAGSEVRHGSSSASRTSVAHHRSKTQRLEARPRPESSRTSHPRSHPSHNAHQAVHQIGHNNNSNSFSQSYITHRERDSGARRSTTHITAQATSVLSGSIEVSEEFYDDVDLAHAAAADDSMRVRFGSASKKQEEPKLERTATADRWPRREKIQMGGGGSVRSTATSATASTSAASSSAQQRGSQQSQDSRDRGSTQSYQSAGESRVFDCSVSSFSSAHQSSLQQRPSSTTSTRTSTSSSTASQTKKKKQKPRRDWKTAVDPKSGRTYYYDAITRETQWRKPLELATDDERRAIQEKERKQKEFFSAMEANILRHMQQGQVPGSPQSKDEEEDEALGEMPMPSSLSASGKKIDTLAAKADGTAAAAKTKPKGKLLPKSAKPGRTVRTISMMGDATLLEMTKVQDKGKKSSSPTSVTSVPLASAAATAAAPTSPSEGSSSAGAPNKDKVTMSAISTSFVDRAIAATHRRSGSDGSDGSKDRDRAIEQAARVADQMVHLEGRLEADSGHLDSGDSPLVGATFASGSAASEDSLSLSLSHHASPGGGDSDGVLTPPPKVSDLRQVAKPNLAARNTCGTIYVSSTMSAPDKDATIKCVCGVYRAHMLQAAKDEASTGFRPAVLFDEYEIFNDRPKDRRTNLSPPRSSGKSGLSSSLTAGGAADWAAAGAGSGGGGGGPFVVSQSQAGIEALSLESVESAVPSLDEITNFYRDVFRRSQMETDCIIMSLIYVERLIKETNGGVRPRVGNWRSVLFASMVMASKVWDDLSMWNADFSQTCPAGVKFTLRRINELELAMLGCLKFSVKVPASEYAKYYFLLRSMMIRSGLAGDDLMKSMAPLDVEGAKKLEVMSSRFRADGERDKLKTIARGALTGRSKSTGEVERARTTAAAEAAGGGGRSSPTSSGGANKVNLEQVVDL